MINELGRTIEDLCSRATREVVLAAPFIKVDVLARMLGVVRPEVDVTVVSRWRPQDIAARVCDVEIWDVISSRPKSRLLVRDDIHAKAYCADDDWLVGSANLTNTALGYSTAPNLELLVRFPANSSDMCELKDAILAAVVVDADLAAATKAVAKNVPPEAAVRAFIAEQAAAVPRAAAASWLPTLRQPEDLLAAYSGCTTPLTASVLRAARQELATLGVPEGLDEASLKAFVGVAMMRAPLVRAIDEYLVTPRRFGELRTYLAGHTRASDEPTGRALQALIRWMLLFLPDRYEYRRPRHSELLARRM